MWRTVEILVFSLLLLNKTISGSNELHNGIEQSDIGKSFSISNFLKSFYCEKSSVVDLLYDDKNDRTSDIAISILMSFESCNSFQISSILNSSLVEKRKRVFNMIVLESFESFLFLAKRIKSFNFDFNGFYSVIFVDIELSEVEQVFNLAWKNFLYNFNLIKMHKQKTLMYTFEPFRSGKCGDTSPLLAHVGLGNETTLQANIFPSKIKNLHKCPLRVPRLNYFPATQFGKNPNDSVVTGIEGDMLMAVKEILNFTIQVVVLENESDKWGDLNRL